MIEIDRAEIAEIDHAEMIEIDRAEMIEIDRDDSAGASGRSDGTPAAFRLVWTLRVW
jgi:hypothetical protein